MLEAAFGELAGSDAGLVVGHHGLVRVDLELVLGAIRAAGGAGVSH